MSEPRPLIARRLRPGHWVALDAAAAVLLGAGFSAAALLQGRVVTVPLLLASWLPLAVRRRWPGPVFYWVLAAATLAGLAGESESYLVVAVALHMVALSEPRRPAVVALVVSLLVVAAVGSRQSSWAQALSLTAFAWLLLGLSWTVGMAVREQRAHAARAIRQSARQAVTDERLRIARELHDVVAHSLSVITVRAAIANHVAETHPEEARRALALVEETGHAALADMRLVLGTLRPAPASTHRDGGTGGIGSAPGLAGIPALAAGARAAGVAVDLRVDLEPTVSEGVGPAVYRIVQEALTNVIKHAAPTRCQVTVAPGEPGEVMVVVSDEGPSGPRPLAPPGGSGGQGLAGMRERAALYGGTLSAGPRPGYGFVVEARLPVPAP
ncbi:histidine kinase [Streptosporangium sp. NPDC001681]|uniref:sensor histidine kinase n=1 Tax=Streptosporangium sp. NPDC001681 TaxID=3154395 RepID=UPI00332AC649